MALALALAVKWAISFGQPDRSSKL